MSKKQPERAAGFGDTVNFVDDNGNVIKASVMDANLQPVEGSKTAKGIRLTVVPADNSPFNIVAAYDEGKGHGTWHWPEQPSEGQVVPKTGDEL